MSALRLGRSWPSWIEPFDLIPWTSLPIGWRFCPTCCVVLGPLLAPIEVCECGTSTYCGIPVVEHPAWETRPRNEERPPRQGRPFKTTRSSTERRSNGDKRNG